MTTIKNLLLGLLGGSEFMWDVFLGVLLAFIVTGVFKFAFALWLDSQ